jgi:hypothetical protein
VLIKEEMAIEAVVLGSLTNVKAPKTFVSSSSEILRYAYSLWLTPSAVEKHQATRTAPTDVKYCCIPVPSIIPERLFLT